MTAACPLGPIDRSAPCRSPEPKPRPKAEAAAAVQGGDAAWMARALALAHAMRGHVWPNPPVGCVIVRDDRVVAEAHTQPGGRPHAEAVALAKAGPAALGATLYVTLEPCCHWGRTPPCADAIIAAGIARVVAALQDPDPRVSGGGFARLRAGGVAVRVGEGAPEAARIMSGFLHRIRTGRPELIPCGPDAQTLPDGADARLTLSEAGADVELRSGKVLHLTGDGEALLDQLGALGLTTVALHPAPGCASGRTASAAPVLASGGANRSGRALRSATAIP